MSKDEDNANNAPRRLSGRVEMQDAIANTLESVRHNASIYAQQLEPDLFNTSRIIEAITRIAVGGRGHYVRILVGQGEAAVRTNGRITDLAQRLSSHVQFRQLDRETVAPAEMFVLADHEAYAHQVDNTKPQCLIESATSPRIGALHRRFERLWERSISIPGLHVTGL